MMSTAQAGVKQFGRSALEPAETLVPYKTGLLLQRLLYRVLQSPEPPSSSSWSIRGKELGIGQKLQQYLDCVVYAIEAQLRVELLRKLLDLGLTFLGR